MESTAHDRFPTSKATAAVKDTQYSSSQFLLPLGHHIANAVVIGLAAPMRLTKVTPKLAWGARVVWMGWSALSYRDLEVARRERLRKLLEGRNRKTAMRFLDAKLLELRWGGSLVYDPVSGTHRREFSNVHAAVHDWAQREKVRRSALMSCRMDKDFDGAASDYFKNRLDRHYSQKAIAIKALLHGCTFGLIPHVLMFGASVFDGRRTLDNFLFGEVASSTSDLNLNFARDTKAVLGGLEEVSWHHGAFEGDKEGDVCNEAYNALIILDRNGKHPPLLS